MNLSDDQVKQYQESGHLLLPDVFSEPEVDALLAESARLSTLDRPERVLERDGELVRTIYASHELSPLFGRLVRDRRAVDPARQLLDEEVYVFQTKLNPKAPVRGDVFDWHQDFVFWARDDGMTRPDVLNVAVFLDDVTVFNGPIFVIPGSQHSILEEETRTLTGGWWTGQQPLTADLRHKVEAQALAHMVRRHGLQSITGRRGSVLIFGPLLLHASPPNLAPYFRTIIFIRYCALSNVLAPVPAPRPEWLACRHPVRVETLDGPPLTP